MPEFAPGLAANRLESATHSNKSPELVMHLHSHPRSRSDDFGRAIPLVHFAAFGTLRECPGNL